MTQKQNTPRFSEMDMMMLRAGWDPKLNKALAETALPVRAQFTCKICERTAALLHGVADRLEARAISLRTA